MVIDSIPSAIGIAISPLPIIAILLMLMSKRAKSNSIAFAVGWIIVLIIISFVLLLMAEAGSVGSGKEANRTALYIQLGLGILLLFFAFKNWTKRPKPGQKPVMPKWLQSIDKLNPAGAFGLAIILGGVNPKNLTLAIAGILTIAEANISDSEVYSSVAVFVLIASTTMILPVLYYLVAQKQAAKLFLSMKGWLTRYNAIIMALLFLVLGIKIVITASGKLW